MRAFGFAVVVLLGMVSGCARTIAIPAEDRETVSSHEVLIDTTRSNLRLIVTFYGSPVELVRRDCIRGSGLDFYLISGAAGRTVWSDGTGGEAGCDVLFDYSYLDDGMVRLTQYTYDARLTLAITPVPIWATTVTVDPGGQCKTKTEILLKPEDGDEADIQRLRNMATKVFESHADKAMDEYTDILCHLRNIAVRHPGPVLEAMKKIPSDGHFSCIKGDFQWEVERLYEILQGHSPPEDAKR